MVSAAIIVSQLVVAAISPILGRAAETHGRRPILLLGFGILPVKGLLLALIPGLPGLLLAQACDGVSGAVLGIMISLIAADMTRRTAFMNLAINSLALASGFGATSAPSRPAGWPIKPARRSPPWHSSASPWPPWPCSPSQCRRRVPCACPTRRSPPACRHNQRERMMLQAPPAQPGMREDEIDTPALLIDLDAFEYNLDRMAALLAPTGAKLRAHAKTHKSPVIARLQMARGAVGHCVQKVGEAEALAWGGIPDILVSNEVVGPAKLARLVALARLGRIAVCADDAAQVATLEDAAPHGGIRLTVLVEIDVGAGRCGV